MVLLEFDQAREVPVGQAPLLRQIDDVPVHHGLYHFGDLLHFERLREDLRLVKVIE